MAISIGRIQPANFQQKVTIVPSGNGAASAHGGIVEMQIYLAEERSWENNSGMLHEPQFNPGSDWSAEVDVQPSAQSEDDEDTEEFLSPEWD